MREKGLINDLSRRQRLHLALVGIVIGLVIAVLQYVLQDSQMPWFQAADLHLQGVYLNQRNKNISSPSELGPAVGQVMLVTIDDDSLRNLKLAWPIPRSRYAQIIDRLKEAGATTIGLDVLFESLGDPVEDARLAEALSDPAVVVPYQLTVTEDFRLAASLPPQRLIPNWRPQDLEKRAGFIWDARGPYQDNMAFRIGFKATDFQGRPILENGKPVEATYYGWPLMLLAHHLQVPPDVLLQRYQMRQLRNQDLGIPITADVATLNIYARPTSSGDEIQMLQENVPVAVVRGLEKKATLGDLLTVVTLDQLLDPKFDVTRLMAVEEQGGLRKPDRFIAIVGVTAEGGYDLKVSRVGPLDGVTLVATAVLNLLRNDFLQEIPPGLGTAYVLVLTLLIGAGAAFLTTRWFLWGLLVPLFFVVCGTSYAGLAGFLTPGPTGALAVPFVPAFLGWFTSGLVLALFKEHIRTAQMEKVITMFREVCPVHDLEPLLEGQGLQLGGEERELTILFSDLRGYTSFAEKLDSVTVLNTLNQYFGAVGHIFERYGGFVFDYQGDAQMVVFGLRPASLPNHAAAACKAGVAMIATLNRMREKWLEAGQNIPETGVGVCTGPVSFGVLGTQQHKQYVAIGDPTNTASRTQGKSAELNAPVLITESAHTAAGDEILAEELEPVVMKGKRKPIQVYRVKMQEMIEKGMVVLDDLS